MFRFCRLILTVVLLSIVAHPAAAQTSRDNQLVIVGNYDESVVLSFFLSTIAVVDGKERGMSPIECEFTATITATEPTGLVTPIDTGISLESGEVFHFEVFRFPVCRFSFFPFDNCQKVLVVGYPYQKPLNPKIDLDNRPLSWHTAGVPNFQKFEYAILNFMELVILAI